MKIIVADAQNFPKFIDAIRILGGGCSIQVQDDVYSTTYSLHSFKQLPEGFITSVQNLFVQNYFVKGHGRGFTAKPKRRTLSGSILATFGQLDKPIRLLTLTLIVEALA